MRPQGINRQHIIFIWLYTISLMSSCMCRSGQSCVWTVEAGGRGLIIYAEDIVEMIASDSDASGLE